MHVQFEIENRALIVFQRCKLFPGHVTVIVTSSYKIALSCLQFSD